MMEMKIKIEVPDLAAAVEKLATAIAVDPNILTPDTPRPQMPGPAATVPPQMPTPATGPAPAMPQTPGPAPAPVTPPPAPAAPVTPPTPAPAPAPQTAAPVMPVAGAPTYTLDQISKAGAALVDAGKMEPLLALLTKYGVQAITQLQPAQYGVFATELRALGAQI